MLSLRTFSVFYTEQANKRLKSLKGIVKSKTHQALSTQPHQTQGKGRQVSIYSISTLQRD